MPSFQEIGQSYASDIRKAVAEDQAASATYVKEASYRRKIDAATLPDTQLIRALKKIHQGVNTGWEINGKPLSEEQKNTILREAGAALGLPRAEDFGFLTKGASNDAYLQLVNHISSILDAARKK